MYIVWNTIIYLSKSTESVISYNLQMIYIYITSNNNNKYTTYSQEYNNYGRASMIHDRQRMTENSEECNELSIIIIK